MGKKTIIALIFLIVILITTGVVAKLIYDNQQTSCTQEVQVCGDGSTVSRNQSNNCEFDICPYQDTGGSDYLLGLYD